MKNLQNPKIIIPDEISNKIGYMCKVINKVEWSAILLYEIASGSIKNPSSLTIVIKDIIPMDKGSATYTEYSFNEKKRDNSGYEDKHIDYCNENEEAIFWRIGLIHSHNNMKTFFSATDKDELKTNSKAHNFYLSLIVNNKYEPIAKIGVMSETEVTKNTTYTAIDEKGEKYNIQKKPFSYKDYLFIDYDCEIEFNQEAFEKVKFDTFYDNVISIVYKEEENLITKKSHPYSLQNSFYSTVRTKTPTPNHILPKSTLKVEDSNDITKIFIKALMEGLGSKVQAKTLDSALNYADYVLRTQIFNEDAFSNNFLDSVESNYEEEDAYLLTEDLINFTITLDEYVLQYPFLEDIIEILDTIIYQDYE